MENVQMNPVGGQTNKPLLSPDERKIALLEARFGGQSSNNNVLLPSYSPTQKAETLKEMSPTKIDVVAKENSDINPDDQLRIQVANSNTNDVVVIVDDNKEPLPPPPQQQSTENLENNWSNGNNSKSNLKRKLDKHDLPIKSPQAKSTRMLSSTNAQQQQQQQIDDSNQGRDGKQYVSIKFLFSYFILMFITTNNNNNNISSPRPITQIPRQEEVCCLRHHPREPCCHCATTLHREHRLAIAAVHLPIPLLLLLPPHFYNQSMCDHPTTIQVLPRHPLRLRLRTKLHPLIGRNK